MGEHMSGHMEARNPGISRWWLIVPALTVLIISVAVAHLIDNMYVFGVGAVLTVLLLLPIWWGWSRYLLVALVIYLPFEDAFVPPVHPGSTIVRGLPDLVLLVVFCARAVNEIQRRRPFFGTPLDWPVVFVLIVSLISMLLNHTQLTLAAEGPYLLLRYAVLFYLVASSGFLQRDVRVIIWLLVWVAIAQGALAVAQFVFINLYGYGLLGEPFVQGTMSHANVLGAYLALICIIAAATYSRETGLRGMVELVLLMFLSSAVIVMALSRQSLIALALGLGTIALLRWRSENRLHAIARVALPAIAGTAIGLFAVSVVARALNAVRIAGNQQTAPATQTAGVTQATAVPTAATPSVTTGVSTPVVSTPAASSGTSPNPYGANVADKSSQLSSLSAFINHLSANGGRLYEILRAGPEILKRSPLFGLGPGTFGNQATFDDKQFYASLNVPDLVSSPAHDYLSDVEWMTVFGQLGILGVLGFVWIFGSIGLIGYRAIRIATETLTRSLGVVCVAFVPVFLFLGWTGPNFELRPVSVLPWFVAGLVVSLQRGESSEEQAVSADSTDLTAQTAGRHRDVYDGWEDGRK